MGMRIIEFKAENVKRLVLAEIRPDGNVVQITGRNGQGKTTVLDAIWWALAGTSNIQSEPIRQGAQRALIRLDLGEMIVTRTFRKGPEGDYTSSVTVERADGSVFKSPQAVLDALVGRLSFDPLAFARMEGRQQFEILRHFIPREHFEKLEKIDAANRDDYSARTEANRKAKELRAAAKEIPLPKTVTSQLIDEDEILAALESAGAHNTEIEIRKRNRAALANDIQSLQEHYDSLMAQAQATREKAEALKIKLDSAPPLPEPVDPSKLRAQLDAARSNNTAYRLKEERERMEKEALKCESEADQLTREMEVREKYKRELIAATPLPVPGLGFEEGRVLLKGVPFEQASDAERLRASIAIAMALNPKLRVVRVRDGSLLDEDSMKILEEMARDNDFQFWVERVDSSGRVGFVLEDGQVHAAI